MRIKEIRIDENTCIGCGSCEALAPRAFEMRYGKSLLKKNWQEEKEANIMVASQSCPVLAIKLIKKKLDEEK